MDQRPSLKAAGLVSFGGSEEEHEDSLSLAASVKTQTWFPELAQLIETAPWPVGSISSRRSTEQFVHPRPGLWALHVWPLNGYPGTSREKALNTITEARAPSTRRLYALKWSAFTGWCAARDLDPYSCDVPSVLSFLQELMETGRTPSTLKVYVVAIAPFHAHVAGQYLGRNDMVVRFLKGIRRLNSGPQGP